MLSGRKLPVSHWSWPDTMEFIDVNRKELAVCGSGSGVYC